MEESSSLSNNVPKRNYEVLIEDFDFRTHHLRINIGDEVTFRLTKNVPFHAEHIIYGVSDNKMLCFESEVLQVRILHIYYLSFIPNFEN